METQEEILFKLRLIKNEIIKQEQNKKNNSPFTRNGRIKSMCEKNPNLLLLIQKFDLQ